MSSIPKSGSIGEETFMQHCMAYGLSPVREYKFADDRNWRFDFAWPHYKVKVAVEVEGGTWIQGRHNRGSSIEKDLEKYNCAAREGWVVLRFSTAMVTSGKAIDEVLEVLGER